MTQSMTVDGVTAQLPGCPSWCETRHVEDAAEVEHCRTIKSVTATSPDTGRPAKFDLVLVAGEYFEDSAWIREPVRLLLVERVPGASPDGEAVSFGTTAQVMQLGHALLAAAPWVDDPERRGPITDFGGRKL